jgi:hypothetical protein
MAGAINAPLVGGLSTEAVRLFDRLREVGGEMRARSLGHPLNWEPLFAELRDARLAHRHDDTIALTDLGTRAWASADHHRRS